MLEDTKKHSIILMYVLGFIFTLQSTLPLYINSTFLSQFIDDSRVGIVYTTGALLAIMAYTSIVGTLKRFGAYRTAIGLLIIEGIAILGMAFSKNLIAGFFFFISTYVTISLIAFTFDMFLESFSSDSKTGRIRGNYLTLNNSILVAVPFLSAFILGENNFTRLYIVSALLLIPVFFILRHNFKKFIDTPYTHTPFWKGVGEAWINKNIKAITVVHLMLQFFYAWMIIYMPLYLHDYIGFNWTTIGIMFSIMLLPFPFIQAPLGRIADKKWGEKEMLSIGLIIMGVSTGLIAFMNGQNPFIWGAILFSTRIGAAIVEVMIDTYFFKQVNASSVNTIGFFRATTPIAYVIAPIIATLLFTFIDIKSLFIILGFLMIYGLRYSLILEDTK